MSLLTNVLHVSFLVLSELCSLLSDNGISFLKIGIEVSHARIRSALEQLPLSYGSPEEAAARRKELQVFNKQSLFTTVTKIRLYSIGTLQFYRVAT